MVQSWSLSCQEGSTVSDVLQALLQPPFGCGDRMLSKERLIFTLIILSNTCLTEQRAESTSISLAFSSLLKLLVHAPTMDAD